MSEVLFGQVLAVVGVARVTDFTEPLDELVDLALPERDAEIDGVVSWGTAVQLPAAGEVPLGVFDGKIVPTALSGGCADGGESGEQSRESE